MSPVRVGYVREHFSSPLLQYAQADCGNTFTLVECPSGTGQLISRLTNDEIDIAIALTDPLISAIANGSEAYKLVGSYVTTPLDWAVVTGIHSNYHQISDLKHATIGISRLGSGSQTMAYIMARQQSWPAEDLKFQVNNDIQGLIDSVNNGSTGAFLWEWFTTKPWVDSRQVRFIGSVPTPWPSWLIAAHPSGSRTPPDFLRTFLNTLSIYVKAFDSQEHRENENVKFIRQTWEYPEADIKAWMGTVKYTRDCTEIPAQVIMDTLSELTEAGVIPKGGEWDARQFVNTDIVKLV